MKMKPSSLLLTTLASVILTACGGGSSGANNSSSSASDTSSSIISTSSSSSVVSSVVAESSLSSSSSSSQVSSEDSGITSSSSSAISSSSSSLAPNIAPVFTGDGMVSLAEGVTVTGFTATATDANGDALTYAITGGADQDLFTIDATTGALSFVLAPDFEAPSDADTNNVYLVQITVTDGQGGSAEQNVSIQITDVPKLLTSLSTQAEGMTLSAVIDCEGCTPAATTYEWYLEGSDQPVSTDDSFTLQVADRRKKITLKATPRTVDGAIGESESLVMMRNQVEDIYLGQGVYVALKTNHDAVVGKDYQDQYHYKVSTEIVKDIESVVMSSDRASYALAGIKADGSVVTWGNENAGGEITYPGKVKAVFNEGFIGITAEDGSEHAFGGYSLDGFEQLENVRKLVSTGSGAYAIYDDGQVYKWEDFAYAADSSDVDLTNVTNIYNYGRVFVATKADGSIVDWNSGSWDKQSYLPETFTSEKVVDLVGIASTYTSFSAAIGALKENGDLIVWGSDSLGGSPEGLDLTDIAQVVASDEIFAAKKEDGSLLMWGDSVIDTTGIKVKKLYSNKSYIAAILEDGSLAIWDGRYGESESLESISGRVIDVVPGPYNLVLVMEDGHVEMYGDTGYYLEYTPISTEMTKVEKVFVDHFPNGAGDYAAVTEDGKVFLWGDFMYGGDLGEGLEPEFIELSNSLKIN